MRGTAFQSLTDLSIGIQVKGLIYGFDHEEEPDYYKYHGGQIFKYSYLTNKSERDTLSEAEQQELESLQEMIPQQYLDDFIGRREVNQGINHYVLELAQYGIIDHLIILLDDNSQYGFSPREQQMMICRTQELGIMDRVMIYPEKQNYLRKGKQVALGDEQPATVAIRFGHCLDEVQAILATKMNSTVAQYLGDIKEGRIGLENVHFPWIRMFEIGFELTID